ncbi:MAG: hypothetical protein ABFS14_07570 [Gemmatimonadota bacterium]
MGTKSLVLVALLVSASAFSGASIAAERTDQSLSVARAHSIRVSPPTFAGCLPSLEEGFAYIELRNPVARGWDRLQPPTVAEVDAPTIQDALPRLEEGASGFRRPRSAYQIRRPVRLA